MAGIKSNILQNLQELTKDIPSKKLLKFPVYDYNEEQSSLERAKQSAKKIKKLEIWNSEADAFTTAASVRPETLIAALSEPGSPKSEKKIKKPKEARYQSIKGQKINKKAGKAPENFSEKEKSGLLDLFVKTQKFQTYGFKEGAPETEMQTSILIEPDNGERAPKIDLRPASVALVADRKNYEKTRHRESSALFEFSLAKEKALATAFSDRPFLSADELFREFDYPTRDARGSVRSNHRSDHRVDTNSRPTGREPKWDDGSRTHSLPGLMGKEHYAENAHPGFVPDKNQFKLPRSGFTRVLTTSLWASRLKNGVSSEICEKRFAKFGDVVLLKLFPDEASALVRFANRKTVVEALYGGKTELDSSGDENQGVNFRNVKLEFARGDGLMQDNFSSRDGVSYVATADIAHLQLKAESSYVKRESRRRKSSPRYRNAGK